MTRLAACLLWAAALCGWDEDAAYDWINDRYRISARLYEVMLSTGFIPGMQRRGKTIQIPWRGVVVALWKLELGVPVEDEPAQTGAEEVRSGANEGRRRKFEET